MRIANEDTPVSASVGCDGCGRYRGPLDLLERLHRRWSGSQPGMLELREIDLLRCHILRASVEVSLTGANWAEFAALEGRVTVAEKLDRLIELVGRKTVPGASTATFEVDRLTVGVPDDKEWDFLLSHMEETGIVFRDGANLRLTVKGWERYGSAETRSRRCFIAMSFAPELDAAHDAISRAIRECSLVPVRVDLVHHNEKICDRVVAEIKGSGYMVADVTFHRQNVYFEAGLAAGMEIGLDKNAAIEFASPFAVGAPVVFYGTSITQGGCASRPGMSYQAILGRQLNLNHVNLGFSGNGKGEAAVARAVAEIDAAAFVLDFAQNNSDVDSLAQVYDPFIGILRERHPDTPIVSITPIYAASEATGSQRNEQMRALIRKVVSRRIAAGDTHLQLVEGTDLLGPSRVDGLVDGTHPNDLGFQWMAEGLAERLRKVLGL